MESKQCNRVQSEKNEMGISEYGEHLVLGVCWGGWQELSATMGGTTTLFSSPTPFRCIKCACFVHPQYTWGCTASLQMLKAGCAIVRFSHLYKSVNEKKQQGFFLRFEDRMNSPFSPSLSLSLEIGGDRRLLISVFQTLFTHPLDLLSDLHSGVWFPLSQCRSKSLTSACRSECLCNSFLGIGAIWETIL